MPDSAEPGRVVGRRWKYAPPPWRMFEALTDELDHWLSLLTGETKPEVARAVRPSLVVLRPWVDKLINSVEVEITGDGGPGSALLLLATASASTLSDEERRWTRYRLGTIFGSALRDWVDEPHF